MRACSGPQLGNCIQLGQLPRPVKGLSGRKLLSPGPCVGLCQEPAAGGTDQVPAMDLESLGLSPGPKLGSSRTVTRTLTALTGFSHHLQTQSQYHEQRQGRTWASAAQGWPVSPVQTGAFSGLSPITAFPETPSLSPAVFCQNNIHLLHRGQV